MSVMALLVPGTEPFGLQKSQPVLWSRTKVPVAKGYNQVALLIKFVSPCAVFTEELIHPDLLPMAKARCEEIYERLFTSQLEKMCPSQPLTSVHNISKRFVVAPILFTITATILAGVGLGVTGVVTAVQAQNQIKTVSEILAEQSIELKGQAKMDEFHDLALKALQNYTTELGEKFSEHAEDYSIFNTQSVDTSFLISFSTSRLLIGNFILKEMARKWKAGKLYSLIFDYLNYTLPCAPH
jgi:hypothetical protein